ncbi:hypothetical protein GW931_00605 [archaeon]|nr:hypothetical protein [archaeon]
MNSRKPSVVEADFHATRTFLEKYFNRTDKDFLLSQEEYYFDKINPSSLGGLNFGLIKGRKDLASQKMINFHYGDDGKITIYGKYDHSFF